MVFEGPYGMELVWQHEPVTCPYCKQAVRRGDLAVAYPPSGGSPAAVWHVLCRETWLDVKEE